MTEKSLQAAIADLLDLLGILWYHTYDSRRSNKGWPDLAICGGKKFIMRELKTDNGNLTDEQVKWGQRLQAVGIDWAIWRPADLWSNRIRDELKAIQ